MSSLPSHFEWDSGFDGHRTGERRATGAPRVIGVRSLGNGGNREASLQIRDREIRAVHREHVGRHSRMNVAEDPAEARTIEGQALGGSNRIQAEIEPFS